MEINGTGKDLRGMWFDVDTTTLDCIAINCGGNLASGKSVMTMGADGTPVAGSRMLTISAAKNIYGLYVDVDPTTNDANYFNTGSNLAAAKAIIRLAVDAGIPDTTAALLRADAAKSMYGIYSDVDAAVNPANYFNCGADLAAGTAVIYATVDIAQTLGGCLFKADAAQNLYGFYSDVDATGFNCNYFTTGAATGAGFAIVKIAPNAGTPDALGCGLIVDMTAATLINNPNAVYIKSAGTGSQVYIESTYAGASGAAITLYHNRSAAVSDYPFSIVGTGKDDAGNAHTWCSIKTIVTTAAHLTEASTMQFYVMDGGGNLDLMLALSANKLLVGKDGNAYVSSFGAYDLILETNDGTNSSTITITDGVNGNITLSPNGTGSSILTNAAVRYNTRACNTTPDTPTSSDGVVNYTTGAGGFVVTIPEAANNLGLELTLTCIVHGGGNITATRTGADVIDDVGDLANTAISFTGAAQAIVIRATSADRWVVVKNIGTTLV